MTKSNLRKSKFATLDFFIEKCEQDLIDLKKITQNTLNTYYENLSKQDKIICSKVVAFLTNNDCKTLQIEEQLRKVTQKKRVLVCRLIPFAFQLNTQNPVWSSRMMENAIKSTMLIPNATLCDVCIAIFEVVSHFDIPLNAVVKNFCLDFSRVFYVNYRFELKQFKKLMFWFPPTNENNTTIAFLKYLLIPFECYNPDFLIQMIETFSKDVFFDEYVDAVDFFFTKPLYYNKLSNWLETKPLNEIQREKLANFLPPIV
ncbi:MAG: hypothetical protein EAZ55_07500 [Cytophagales bacterium]|nr:MAG: hypothetical protein EAZ55_07500 [Cytophagales bacterium]